jgi:hypothetical protein
MAGYSRLAALMRNRHDLAIFRQFSDLNAKNLLYMQGELVRLEVELEMIATENKNSKDTEKNDFEKSITTMIGPHRAEDGQKTLGKDFGDSREAEGLQFVIALSQPP